MNYETQTPELKKMEFGSPIQIFSVKEQGIGVHRKELLGTIIILAFGAYLIYSVASSISYLGRNTFVKMRLNFQTGFWRIVWIVIMIANILHIKHLFQTQGEVYDKGFYLKQGSKEHAYTFKQMQRLQKVFLKGANNTITTIMLVLMLETGEEVNINGSGNELMIQFSDALSLQYAQSKKSSYSESFKKGEKLGFGLVEIDKTSLHLSDKVIPRSEIAVLKKARADRYWLVLDNQEKKLAKLDWNKIHDEDLFKMILEEQGIKFA